MGQPQEKPTVEQVMQLVDQLTQEEREQILDELKMANLRRSIQIGIEQANRGEVVDGEVVLAELRGRSQERLRKSQQ